MPFMAIFARTLRLLATCALVVFGMCAMAAAILSREADSPSETGGNLRLLTVTSGSMVPVFHAGDAILVRTVSDTGRRALRPGQVITFRAQGSDTLVTHRIVSVIPHADSRVEFVTKGDANEDVDLTPIDAQDVIGIHTFTIPFAGFALRPLSDPRIPLFLVIAAMFSNWSVLAATRSSHKGSPGSVPVDTPTTHTYKGTTT